MVSVMEIIFGLLSVSRAPVCVTLALWYALNYKQLNAKPKVLERFTVSNQRVCLWVLLAIAKHY